jgi:hypothetical protein
MLNEKQILDEIIEKRYNLNNYITKFKEKRYLRYLFIIDEIYQEIAIELHFLKLVNYKFPRSYIIEQNKLVEQTLIDAEDLLDKEMNLIIKNNCEI